MRDEAARLALIELARERAREGEEGAEEEREAGFAPGGGCGRVEVRSARAPEGDGAEPPSIRLSADCTDSRLTLRSCGLTLRRYSCRLQSPESPGSRVSSDAFWRVWLWVHTDPSILERTSRVTLRAR